MLADMIITGLQFYSACGAVCALVFLCWGIDRIDPAARGVFVFRPLLVPGIVMLWPFVLWRWFNLERGMKDKPC